MFYYVSRVQQVSEQDIKLMKWQNVIQSFVVLWVIKKIERQKLLKARPGKRV